MGGQRRSFDDAFKAKVALDAIRGEKTIEELDRVNPTQIRRWKREFEAGAAKVFSGDKETNRELKQLQEEKTHLEQLIGKQTIEINWLKKLQRSSTCCESGHDSGKSGYFAQ